MRRRFIYKRARIGRARVSDVFSLHYIYKEYFMNDDKYVALAAAALLWFGLAIGVQVLADPIWGLLPPIETRAHLVEALGLVSLVWLGLLACFFLAVFSFEDDEVVESADFFSHPRQPKGLWRVSIRTPLMTITAERQLFPLQQEMMAI